jgi:acetyl esterase/lipase
MIAAALMASFALSACGGPQILNVTARVPGEVRKDVAYGPSARARMDVYTPANASPDTPVMVFIHGGSWQSGSKDEYKFLGAAFARRGIETVIINYRVHPEAVFPAFMADAAQAVAMVKRDMAGQRPLFLAGHSAGAQIASLLALDPRFLAAEGTTPCQAIAGVIGIAGPYHFTPVEPVFKEIFPADKLEAARPINYASNISPPTLLLHGTGDTTVSVERSREMLAALKASGNSAELKTYEGVNHTFIVGAISPLVRRAAPTLNDSVEFIEAQKAKNYPGCRSNPSAPDARRAR